jgi:hypothetical protein
VIVIDKACIKFRAPSIQVTQNRQRPVCLKSLEERSWTLERANFQGKDISKLKSIIMNGSECHET